MKWISTNSPEVRRYVKFVALCLLALIALSAFAGGIPMILDGSGAAIGLSTDYLMHTPIQSYRLPGIVLVVLNGVGSMIAFCVLYNNWRYHSYTVRGMGIVLLVWIIIQCSMMQLIDPLHLIVGMLALLLMITGNYLKRFE